MAIVGILPTKTAKYYHLNRKIIELKKYLFNTQIDIEWLSTGIVSIFDQGQVKKIIKGLQEEYEGRYGNNTN